MMVEQKVVSVSLENGVIIMLRRTLVYFFKNIRLYIGENLPAQLVELTEVNLVVLILQSFHVFPVDKTFQLVEFC